MAVVGVPGWIGSSAVNETGQRWMSAARTALRLPAAGWMSQMAGQSKEFRVTIAGSDHNFNTNTLHQWMLNAAGGSWPSGNIVWRIVVNSGVQLVSINTGNACMWFGGGIQGRVIIENHGWIFGRGGNGGRGNQGGFGGGHAIVREGHITLEIVNHGIIAGGGGGGGGGQSQDQRFLGGGGAPFGYPGASITGGGGPERSCAGPGGGLGGGGGRGGGCSISAGGGPSGYAIAGGGPIAWTVRGDIRGPTS